MARLQAVPAAAHKTRKVLFLASPADHASLVKKARLMGLSQGELLRRAVDAFSPTGGDDEVHLRALTRELVEALPSMQTALRNANAKIEEALKSLNPVTPPNGPALRVKKARK